MAMRVISRMVDSPKAWVRWAGFMVNVFMRLCFLLGWVAVGQLLRLADCRTGTMLFVKNAMGFIFTYDTLNHSRGTRNSSADPDIG
jgi:hypothetical protein